jgi:TctA family transporter
MGAVPGLTATMAVALLIPITFFLDPASALGAIVALEACAIFAGDIPAALVRMPGTPSSAAYVDDAYSLVQQGRQHQVFGTALLFSVTGGLIGAAVLITAAPLVAKVAFQFTTYEYFWLYLIGLTSASVVTHGSRLKGTLSMLIGLLFSTVGLSEVHGTARFTFGRDELIAGIDFIPAMIGLFGFSEVLRNVLWIDRGAQAVVQEGLHAGSRSSRSLLYRELITPLVEMLRIASPMLWARKLRVLVSGMIGTVIGILPGAGADIAAWISFGVSKRLSKNPELYGRGSVEGVSDATTANNAALAGAWIPALVFGIPGDSITAIVIGVLLMKNIAPGPQIFTTPKQATMVYCVYIVFILANLLLIPLGYLAVRAGSTLVRMPRRMLVPIILLFCIVGSYAINGSYFDVWVMLLMGVLGFFLEMKGVPLGPMVLGIVLGGRLEQSFIQCLAKSDSLVGFFARPLAGVLGVACLLLWFYPLLRSVVQKLPRGGRAI